jgi:2-keto-3-deoxy-L-rhamnonate aldolase RhmA
MPSPRIPLRTRWADGAETLGAWLTLPSTAAAEIVARLDVEYVCVDLQHGLVDAADLLPLVQAIELAGGVPIARSPWNEPGVIGRILDAGCHGVIVPLVNSVEEAVAAVAAGRYPPAGRRSWGPMLVGGRRERGLAEQRVDESCELAFVWLGAPVQEDVRTMEGVPGLLPASIPGLLTVPLDMRSRGRFVDSRTVHQFLNPFLL